jgi:dipeptidyl aminopeptidase/acylaminoacyl peptidase
MSGILGWVPIAGALALVWSLATGASAAGPDLATAFGQRQAVRHASLSPDGKMVALIQPLADGQSYGLLVAPVDGESTAKPILKASGRPEQLQRCGWVSNTRLVCNVTFVIEQAPQRIGYTRIVAINADGSNLQVLSAKTKETAYTSGQYGGAIVDWLAEDQAGEVMMTREFAQEYSTGTLIANQREGVAVERVNTVSMKRTQVESPKKDAVLFISDQHGTVRIYAQALTTGDGYLRGKRNYYYRKGASGEWPLLSTYDVANDTGFEPVSVDRDLNVAYGFEKIDGRRAIVRISLDGSMKREVILARGDVDVDGLIRIGRQHRVVGVSYATDKRHDVYFDPALKALTESLSKALPGQPPVGVLDASLDEKRLLILASSDVMPGTIFLYDKTTRQLRPLVEMRPELRAVKLAQVRSVAYKAADGTMIPAYLTSPAEGAAKNLPAIVLPHGGPGARDEWGFDWLAQYFAARGYAVLQPNFRGSSGYGDGWFQENGFKSWRTAVGDVNDAARWLQTQGIAAQGKLAIVGWSYGGYAALQSQVLDPDLFKAVVAIAPVTDLDRLREESRNFTNFGLIDDYIGHGAHVREGSPAQNADKIRAPVLMFHGEADDNVDVAESRLMLARLKAAGRGADLVTFAGLDHQIDDSKARVEMLNRIDSFLQTSLGR